MDTLHSLIGIGVLILVIRSLVSHPIVWLGCLLSPTYKTKKINESATRINTLENQITLAEYHSVRIKSLSRRRGQKYRYTEDDMQRFDNNDHILQSMRSELIRLKKLISIANKTHPIFNQERT